MQLQLKHLTVCLLSIMMVACGGGADSTSGTNHNEPPKNDQTTAGNGNLIPGDGTNELPGDGTSETPNNGSGNTLPELPSGGSSGAGTTMPEVPNTGNNGWGILHRRRQIMALVLTRQKRQIMVQEIPRPKYPIRAGVEILRRLQSHPLQKSILSLVKILSMKRY